MKVTCAAMLVLAAGDLATARSIPLPRPRPAPTAVMPNFSETPQPSACRLRLTPDLAIAPSLPPITGPGACEAPDVVRLEAVVLLDRSLVAVVPPANLRCTMAEAIAGWVREQVAPRTLDLGSSLKSVVNFTSFDCRSRNGVVGAKLSEHGKANALDIHSLKLANGKVVELTDPRVPRDFREGLRKSACAQFTTVLGPGSDASHENHIHVDVLERRGGYRICEWDVWEPGEAPSVPAAVASVPLPRARPAMDSRNRPQ
jgi:hypothetical protein